MSDTKSTLSRRKLLKAGAVAAPLAATLKSGNAWAISSTCQVIIKPGNQLTPPLLDSNGQEVPGAMYTAQEINQGQYDFPEHMQYVMDLVDPNSPRFGTEPGASCIMSAMFVPGTTGGTTGTMGGGR